MIQAFIYQTVYRYIMKQILSEETCNNRHFYKCVVKDNKCVNCDKSYVKEGNIIKSECNDCGKVTNIIVDHIWRDGEYRGSCQECLDNHKAISTLYGNFVGACETEDGNAIKELEEKSLDKIVKLPTSQLKTFLRSMNSSIER